jgi:hypothetical protein
VLGIVSVFGSEGSTPWPPAAASKKLKCDASLAATFAAMTLRSVELSVLTAPR